MWRFNLKNGDIFETKSPHHYFTWIVIRTPYEPESTELWPTHGRGPWSAQAQKWKNHAMKQIKIVADFKKTVEIQVYVEQHFRIGGGFALDRLVSVFALIRDGI
jgi:hypothetical protein